MKICVICGKEFTENGNNPWPITDLKLGRCCDECDCLKVIPERLKNLMLPEAALKIGQLDLAMRRWRKDNPDASFEDFMKGNNDFK